MQTNASLIETLKGAEDLLDTANKESAQTIGTMRRMAHTIDQLQRKVVDLEISNNAMSSRLHGVYSFIDWTLRHFPWLGKRLSA